MKIPWTKSWAIKVNFLMSCITSLASVSLHRGQRVEVWKRLWKNVKTTLKTGMSWGRPGSKAWQKWAGP